MPVSVALCENKYISLSQHTFSAHMSKMAQVREKRMGGGGGGTLGKRGGKGRLRKEESTGGTCALCTHLFTCMHSGGPVV